MSNPTGVIFTDPQAKPLSTIGLPQAGAYWLFYLTGTTTPANVYFDGLLATPLSQVPGTPQPSCTADSAGRFNVIYMDPSKIYRAQLFNVLGAKLEDIDPYVPPGIGNQATIGAIIYPQTAAETTALVTPTNFIYPEGDIRRYGATTIAADNHVAINAALSVSAAGGNAAFIPGGTWTITTTITATGSASMYGMGQMSVINANGCDGLSFGAQATYAGSRFMRDFFLSGTSASANNGIIVNFTAASGNKVYNVNFQNLTIENFGTGVFMRGLWDSIFFNCWLYNNYQGYNWNGQSIGNQVIGGFCQKGAITGTGTQNAMQANSVSGEQCQALYVAGWDCFGYDIGFSGGPLLDTQFYGCTLNNCGTNGISLAASSGGFVVRDCWIQTNNAGVATIGINLNALGSPVLDKVIIEGNVLVCNLANAGSIAIFIGSNQTSVTANNNTLGGTGTQWATGISIAGSKAVAKFNTINASGTAQIVNSAATRVELGPNVIQAGTELTFSSLTPADFSYFGEGTFAVTLTGEASGGTGTAIWRANGGMIALKVASAGITGTSNATTMTMTGLPQWLWPNTDGATTAQVIDSGATSLGLARVAAATGVFTFFKDVTGAVFTNTGTKGLNGTTITYSYD